jgi:hypothetical protein
MPGLIHETIIVIVVPDVTPNKMRIILAEGDSGQKLSRYFDPHGDPWAININLHIA